MWDAHDEIKVYGVDRGTQDKLISMLSDDSAEVRAAALYALGTFMGASGSANPDNHGGGGTGTMHQLEERVHFRMEVAVATGATLAIKEDASPMCRKELLVVISCLVKNGVDTLSSVHGYTGKKIVDGALDHLAITMHHHPSMKTTPPTKQWLNGLKTLATMTLCEKKIVYCSLPSSLYLSCFWTFLWIHTTKSQQTHKRLLIILWHSSLNHHLRDWIPPLYTYPLQHLSIGMVHLSWAMQGPA